MLSNSYISSSAHALFSRHVCFLCRCLPLPQLSLLFFQLSSHTLHLHCQLSLQFFNQCFQHFSTFFELLPLRHSYCFSAPSSRINLSSSSSSSSTSCTSCSALCTLNSTFHTSIALGMGIATTAWSCDTDTPRK